MPPETEPRTRSSEPESYLRAAQDPYTANLPQLGTARNCGHTSRLRADLANLMTIDSDISGPEPLEVPMTITADSARQSIKCPHCGQKVLLDEAIAHQLAAPMRAGWEAEMRQAIDNEVRAV